MSVHIFNGSLDMCPTMHPTLLIATVDHLQHIRRVCWYFPALCICSVSSMNRIHIVLLMCWPRTTVNLLIQVLVPAILLWHQPSR